MQFPAMDIASGEFDEEVSTELLVLPGLLANTGQSPAIRFEAF
jgi:hypothetical protein